MAEQYPQYYALNDRPVKLEKTHDGGLAVIALDMRTGEWVRDYNFMSALFQT